MTNIAAIISTFERIDIGGKVLLLQGCHHGKHNFNLFQTTEKSLPRKEMEFWVNFMHDDVQIFV